MSLPLSFILFFAGSIILSWIVVYYLFGKQGLKENLEEVIFNFILIFLIIIFGLAYLKVEVFS